jgi:hypothetical protein
MTWQELTLALGALALDDRQTALLKLLSTEMGEKPAAPVNLDPLARSDLEDELQVWLEDQAIDQAWEIAPVLVACDWNIDKVARLREQFNAAQFAIVIRWLCFGNSIYMLLDEVHTSAGRIAEIVRAVKSYSYLDQAPIQNVDIHAGLEDTLTIHQPAQPRLLMRDYSPGAEDLCLAAVEPGWIISSIMPFTLCRAGQSGLRRMGKTGWSWKSRQRAGIPPESASVFDSSLPPSASGGLGLNTFTISSKSIAVDPGFLP